VPRTHNFVAISNIEQNSKCQARAKLDPVAIEDYAQCMRNGDVFPPLVVFCEAGSERIMLADGFHRIRAAEKAGLTEFDCDVREGNLQDAIHCALGANAENGVRRTNADKVKVVNMALDDPFFYNEDETLKPVREVARYCRVSHEMVRQLQKERLDESTGSDPAEPGTTGDNSVAGNTRVTAPPPTQAEIDRAELVQVCKTIAGFPFNGAEALTSTELSMDYYDAVNFAAEWLGSLAEAMEASTGE